MSLNLVTGVTSLQSFFLLGFLGLRGIGQVTPHGLALLGETLLLIPSIYISL